MTGTQHGSKDGRGFVVAVEVECYAGYRGEETPQRFRLGARSLEVTEVVKTLFKLRVEVTQAIADMEDVLKHMNNEAGYTARIDNLQANEFNNKELQPQRPKLNKLICEWKNKLEEMGGTVPPDPGASPSSSGSTPANTGTVEPERKQPRHGKTVVEGAPPQPRLCSPPDLHPRPPHPKCHRTESPALPT